MEPRPGQLTFGYRHEWGSDLPCFILPEDRRQHVYVIGQTGTGKSTLLLNCITQDIEQGRGVAVIDPHGDLALDVLSRIPKWRTEDVVYLDAAAESPVTLNLFRASGSNWYLVASGIVSAFKKIWGQSWGARMEYILFATLAALIQCDNTSLLGVSRMLYDPAYRAWVVHQVKDPLVRSFWVNEFAGYDKRFLQEVVAPIQNKVGQILFAPPIRNMLGQVASRINFRFMMDHGRILVANLAKGHLGEAHSSLLGALLVTGLEIAALSRADIEPSERREFSLYVDEFQNCATDSFASILSEARKYGLCLTLAHQYTSQVATEIMNAVLGNVGTLLAFRVGESDASILERQFGSPYTAQQFSGLENYELCAKLLNRTPFLARSLPAFPGNASRRTVIVSRSRQKYALQKRRIEERIAKWLARRH